MTSAASIRRVLPVILVLIAASWGVSAYAQTAIGSAAPTDSTATAPGPIEHAENATKKAVNATVKAGSIAIDATKRGVKKMASAVTRTGEKIKAKFSGTKAGDKKNNRPVKPISEAK